MRALSSMEQQTNACALSLNSLL